MNSKNLPSPEFLEKFPDINQLIPELKKLKPKYLVNSPQGLRCNSHYRIEDAENFYLTSELFAEYRTSFPDLRNFILCYNLGLPEIPKCPICGKPKAIANYNQFQYLKTCGDLECSNHIRESSCLEKYGVSNISKSPESQEKTKETFLKKYGVTNPNKLESTKQKVQETRRKNNKVIIGKSIPWTRIKERFIQKHGDRYDYFLTEKSYKNLHSSIPIVCRTHGVFYQQAQEHLNGCGCPRCKSSVGENEIRKYLQTKNICFEEQKSFETCKYKSKLKFDFYLPDYSTVIEFQGIQHYESLDCFGGEVSFKENQKRDQIKRDWCYNNNIREIEISYKDISNIEKILEETLNQ